MRTHTKEKSLSQCFFNRKTEQLSIVFTNKPQETFTQGLVHKETHKCQVLKKSTTGIQQRLVFLLLNANMLKSFNIYS